LGCAVVLQGVGTPQFGNFMGFSLFFSPPVGRSAWRAGVPCG